MATGAGAVQPGAGQKRQHLGRGQVDAGGAQLGGDAAPQVTGLHPQRLAARQPQSLRQHGVAQGERARRPAGEVLPQLVGEQRLQQEVAEPEAAGGARPAAVLAGTEPSSSAHTSRVGCTRRGPPAGRHNRRSVRRLCSRQRWQSTDSATSCQEKNRKEQVICFIPMMLNKKVEPFGQILSNDRKLNAESQCYVLAY